MDDSALESARAGEGGGPIAVPGIVSVAEAAATGRRLWLALVSLAAVGVFSFIWLAFQVVNTQTLAGDNAAERARLESELEAMNRKLVTLGGEITVGQARRAELMGQIATAEKDVQHLSSELEVLKGRRAALTAKVEELARRAAETEQKAVLAEQRRAELELGLEAARAELADLKAKIAAAAGRLTRARPPKGGAAGNAAGTP